MCQGCIALWCALLVSLSSSHVEAVRFVAILPVSGKSKDIGSSYLRGYNIAFEEFEEGGGLIWRGVKQNLSFGDAVHLIDDASSSSKGPTRLNEYLTEAAPWTEEDPVVVLGGYGSSSVVGQLRVTDKHKVVMVNGGGASEEMYRSETEGGQNTNKLGFGLLSPVSKMASTTLEYMMTRMDRNELKKPCTIALIWEDASHGQAYREVVTQYSLQYPEYFEMAYAADFTYPNSGPDSIFAKLATDVFNENKYRVGSGLTAIDTLLVDAHSADFIRIQNSFSKLDFNFNFVTYGARGTDTVDIEALNDPASANQTISAQWWGVSLNKVKSRQFIRRWRITEAFKWAEESESKVGGSLFSPARDQLEVSWYGALGYQTALVLLEALNTTTDQTQTGLSKYLRSNTFTDTILPGGAVKFDSFGQATNDYTILQANLKWKTSEKGSTALVNTALTLFPKEQVSGEFQVKTQWSSQSNLCDASHVGNSVSDCSKASLRTVSFFWVDSSGYRCDPPTVACSCTENDEYPLPSPFSVECEFIAIFSHNGIVVLVLSCFGALICFVSHFFLMVHFDNVVMKAGQREFLVVMCFAGVWCNLASFSFLGPNTDEMCVTRILYLLMSVTLLIGSLTVKVYRIYKIWNNTSMKRIVVTAKDMFKVLCLIMLGMVVIFSVWMSVQTPHRSTSVHVHSVGLKTVEITGDVCSYSEGIAFPALAVGYFVLILLYCNVLSFQGRNSASKYMESRSIMFASYCMTFILLLVILLVALTNLTNGSQILLICLSLVFTSILFVGLVLGPKVYFATRPTLELMSSRIRRSIKGSSVYSSIETSMVRVSINKTKVVASENGSQPPSSILLNSVEGDFHHSVIEDGVEQLTLEDYHSELSDL